MPGDMLEGFSLSPQQRRLWRLQQAERGMPYLARCAVRIDGALDTALLAAALRQVVDRYEILRTTFRQFPGMTMPLQVIAERADPALQEHDLGGLDAAAQAAAVAIAGELSLAPLDLAGGPLLRCALARLSPDRHLLLIALPSLCADAPALANLAGALSRAYAGCARRSTRRRANPVRRSRRLAERVAGGRRRGRRARLLAAAGLRGPRRTARPTTSQVRWLCAGSLIWPRCKPASTPSCGATRSCGRLSGLSMGSWRR